MPPIFSAGARTSGRRSAATISWRRSRPTSWRRSLRCQLPPEPRPPRARAEGGRDEPGPMNGPVRLIEHTRGMGVPADEHRFLDELEGPVVIKVAGRRAGPGRVVGGLMHGNEPSGLRAIHRYLCELDP